jgi:chromosome segregation ATPase
MARLAAAERSLQDAKEMIDALEADKLTLEHSQRSLQATVDQLTSSNGSLKDKLYEQRETLNAQMRDLRRSAAETVRQYEEERTAVQSHLTKVRITDSLSQILCCISTFLLVPPLSETDEILCICIPRNILHVCAE